jgi:PAS domain S-box-containing protein
MNDLQTCDKIDFRAVAKASGALVWVADTSRSCIWFNDAWLTFTGRTLAQEIGSGWLDGIHLDDYDRCLQTYVVSFDARRPFTLEYRLHHHTGKYRWILVQGVPLFGDSGNFLGFSVSGWDINNHKEQEAHIRYLEHYDRLTDVPNLSLDCARASLATLTMRGTSAVQRGGIKPFMRAVRRERRPTLHSRRHRFAASPHSGCIVASGNSAPFRGAP